MAFDEKEKQIIQFGLQEGKTREEVETALKNYRFGKTGVSSEYIEPTSTRIFSTRPSDLGETIGDVTQAVRGVGREIYGAGQRITEVAQRGDLGIFDKALGIGAEAFKGGSRAFGEALLGVAKWPLTSQTEQRIKGRVGEVAQGIIETDTIQGLMQKYNSLDPVQKRRVDNILGYGEGLADLFSFKAASNILRPLIQSAYKAIDTVVSVGERGATKIDDLLESSRLGRTQPVETPTTPTAKALKEVQEAAPDLTFKEKFAGLTEDVKGRLQEAGPSKVQEYIDVVKASNLSDKAPTPYAYGALRVEDAVSKMKEVLNETGSGIGQTRRKLATVKAPINSVQTIQQSFLKELDNLNLEVMNGAVRQKPGTITRVGSVGDIKVLNDLYQSYRTFSQSPTLLNMIDLRNAFDNQINFAKRASEVSGSVDGISRQVRKSIADEANVLVGKEGAADLAKYSEFMDALTELQNYTNRQAGGEYLLRLVGSGRGREAQQIINTVKELTGIDLMNDATLMTLVTDLMGNARTKTLFSQQITQAGVDVAKILQGNPSGLIGILGRYAKRKLLDEEKLLLEASQPRKASTNQIKNPTPTITPKTGDSTNKINQSINPTIISDNTTPPRFSKGAIPETTDEVSFHLKEFLEKQIGEKIESPDEKIRISKNAQFSRRSLKHIVDSRTKQGLRKDDIEYLINKAKEVATSPDINVPNKNKTYPNSRMLGKYYEDKKKAVMVILDDGGEIRDIISVFFKKRSDFQNLLKFHGLV